MRLAPFVLILLILVGGVALAYQTYTNPAQDASQPLANRPTVTPRPLPTSSRTAQSTATPAALIACAVPSSATPTGSSPLARTPTASPVTAPVLRVGNTDGQGVYLRGTPNLNDKIRPWQDGTAMVLVGPEVRRDGITWQHVKAPDGVEGYVPSQYLIGGLVARD